jgi:DNA-binding NarL/FixJ family response regulator
MRPINAVLAHHDPVVARGLADSLRPDFRKLTVAGSLSEARAEIARLRANFVIVDLEMLSYAEVKQLCSEFPGTAFACIHRLADEAMWQETLAVGAVDCCQSNDLRGILRASERHVKGCAAAAA